MANAYTDIQSGTSLGLNLVQTAYDRLVEFALRAQPLHRALADKRPAEQAMPGSSVVFQFYSDLPQQTASLTEDVDPDAIALPSTSTVSVTLNEYGATTLTTRKLEMFSLSDVDPAVANIVAFNQADSLDTNVVNVLCAGTNVVRVNSGVIDYNGGATSSITGTDTITSECFRLTVAKMRTNKAVPRRGMLYACYLHPEVSHDLRAETGSGGWRTPHEYAAGEQIWSAEIGQYEGAFFVETPRAYQATDGATATRVFRTLVAGQQALAEAVAEEPHVVIGPVVDKLMRFRPLGWYGILGWSVYRQASLCRIETTSSIDKV